MRVAATLLVVVIALAAVSLLPVRQTEHPPFASPAFQRAFNVDSSAASRAVDLWGSEPLLGRVEPYHGAPNDRRMVQYFDRGRMETMPGSSGVTHGLLARELATGEIDLGDGVDLERQPPEISIDSLELDDRVPTYLTLSRLVAEPARDRSESSARVEDWIARGGLFEQNTSPEVVRYAEYVTATGHNLPDVTVDLFARSEFANGRWIEAFGYPISEPYWTHFRRGADAAPSLVQVFERRILIYTPDMASDKRFTVASTGRHYYAWRYGADLTEVAADVATPDEADGIVTLDGFTATTYAADVGIPIDLTLSPGGHPLILTREGQILKPVTLDPDGTPEEFAIWAEGIDAPLGIATSGGSIVVTTESGVHWYREREGAGNLQDTVEYRGDLAAGLVPVEGPDFSPDGRLVGAVGDPAEIVSLVATDSDSVDEFHGDAFEVLDSFVYSESDLYLTGEDADNRARVAMVPGDQDGPPSGDQTVLASFPPGTTAQALAIADIEVWPATGVGEVFVAVEDQDGTRVYSLPRDGAPESSEAVEFASGLDGPVAMIFGLDGSLYIADADHAAVYRISPTGSD